MIDLENSEKAPAPLGFLRNHRRENYGKAPWHTGLVRFLTAVGASGLALSLLVVAPIAAARAAGLGLFAQVAAPFVLLLLLTILMNLALRLIDVHADDEDNTSRWVRARVWTATADPSMGDWLRREREERGLSLADITAKTRIHARYLRAIEDDRFDLLPGGILRRSFLRQYAEQVGLVSATVVALFDAYVHGRTAAASSTLVLVPHHGLAPTARSAVSVEVVRSDTPLGHRAARTLFGMVEALLPKRLAREELGDALEYIAANPGWRAWVKIVSTIFWTGVNAVREWRSAFGGKQD